MEDIRKLSKLELTSVVDSEPFGRQGMMKTVQGVSGQVA